jgi:uncharacterized repeat protein (TIGR01451 family)
MHRRRKLETGAAPTSIVLIVLLAAALASWPALAADPAPRLAMTLQVERETARTDVQGTEAAAPESVIATRSGDVLVYTLKADNRGDAPAFDLKLQDPVPQGTVLIVDSLVGFNRPADASLDGGMTWQPYPARVKRVAENGTELSIEAPPEAYTNLRWIVPGPVPPGGTTKVSFKVRVI